MNAPIHRPKRSFRAGSLFAIENGNAHRRCAELPAAPVFRWGLTSPTATCHLAQGASPTLPAAPPHPRRATCNVPRCHVRTCDVQRADVRRAHVQRHTCGRATTCHVQSATTCDVPRRAACRATRDAYATPLHIPRALARGRTSSHLRRSHVVARPHVALCARRTWHRGTWHVAVARGSWPVARGG